MAPTLALMALLSLATASAFAVVGVALAQRRRGAATAEARRAASLWAAWWGSMALLMTMDGAVLLLASAGLATSLVARADLVAWSVLMTAALTALVSYVLLVVKGRPGALVPVLCYHAALGAAVLVDCLILDPQGFTVTTWGATPRFGGDSSGLVTALLVLAFLAPALVAGARFGWLARQVGDSTVRYRILLTFLSLSMLLLLFVLGPAAVARGPDVVQVGLRLAGLAAGILAVFAYNPPGWVRRRYHVRSLQDERALTG